MEIFNIDTAFVPTPETRAKRIIQFIKSSIETLRKIQMEGIDLAWNLPNGMTTQEVFDALDILGTNLAKELIILNVEFSSFLETFKPGSSIPLPEGCSVTINPDNTVTAIRI